jgi:hypothetical protein
MALKNQFVEASDMLIIDIRLKLSGIDLKAKSDLGILVLIFGYCLLVYRVINREQNISEISDYQVFSVYRKLGALSDY